MSKFSSTKKRKFFLPSFHFKKINLSPKTASSLKNGLIFLSILFFLLLSKKVFLSIKQSKWDYKHQLTVAYEQNNKIGFLKFDPLLQEVTILYFPQKSMINLSQGYEKYQADKIKALASQEKINLGKLLKNSMTQFLGVLTDGYIVNLKGDELKLSKILWQATIKKADSNLTAWDLLRLHIFVSNLKIDRIKILNIEEEGVGQLVNLPDGNEVFEFDQNRLDLFVLRQLASPEFLKEKLTWEIYNGTYHDGLAGSMKRIVANSGFDVIGIRQGLEEYQKSTIYVNKDYYKNDNIRVFADFFEFDLKIDKNKTYRSDVAIYIGEDFWRRYYTSKKNF
jgi:LytR cell envelope-related transcriptional attenuator